jgi:hypothetical protein
MSARTSISALLLRIQPRRREKWDDVPNAIIACLAAICSLEALFYGTVMKDAGLPFLKLMNEATLTDWANPSFICCLVLTALIGSQIAIWSFAATGLVKILHKRVFGV